MALFEVRNISMFSPARTPIVNDVSLTIEKGTTNAFLGKSGCGKTTIIKLISGILLPDEGEVFFEGKNVHTMTKSQNLDFRRRCGFIFQDAALWANQDIATNLSLPLQIHFPKMTKDERDFTINSICAMVDFTKPLSLRPADLSLGEQKKVAFARAMVLGPEILFLDEAIASLDLRSTEIITSLLQNFLENGNTIVYVSHNADFIKAFPGISHIVEKGRIKKTVEHLQNIDKVIREFESDDDFVDDKPMEIKVFDGVKIKI